MSKLRTNRDAFCRKKLWSNDNSEHGWQEKEKCHLSGFVEPINNVWRVTEIWGEENPRRKAGCSADL